MSKKLTLSKQAIVDAHAAHALEKSAVAAKRAKKVNDKLKKSLKEEKDEV